MRTLWFAFLVSGSTFPLGPAGHAVLAYRCQFDEKRPTIDDCGGKPGRFWEKKPLRYAGGLLGVEADVLLFPAQERAVVRLRGIPVGGTISGVATFKSDGQSVDLDPELAQALRRRHVLIAAAGTTDNFSAAWVKIHLPLGLGHHTLELKRTD